MPKVSLVVPAYNAEKYISKCLQSILGQSEREIQIIVINDGSVDRTKEIVESFMEKDTRICLHNQKNRGLVYSRKQGIDLAEANYVMFVDADDWIAENAVEELYKAIIEDTVDIMIPGIIYAFDKTREVHRIEDKIYRDMEYFDALMQETVPHNIASCLYKKSVFAHVPWEQCEALSMGEDLVLNILIASRGVCAETVSREYYYYYQNASSMSHVDYDKIVKIYTSLDVIKAYLEQSELLENYKPQMEFLYYLHGIHYHGIMPFQRNYQVRKRLAARWRETGIDIYHNPCYLEFARKQPFSKKLFMLAYRYSFHLNYFLGSIAMPVFSRYKGRK